MNPDTLLSDKIKLLPHQPGVYLMRDGMGEIIYIGKAKDLAHRVGSYFTKTELPPKVRSLIYCIRRLDFITTVSEREALILENRLIKKYQPRYNVIMRDDKTYPYLKLTLAEDFPRLMLTRKKKRDGGMYFGPYPQVNHVRSILQWLQKNFALRYCTYDISTAAVLPAKKYASCLYLHMKSCPAPCTGAIAKTMYAQIVKKIILFLQGTHNQLIHVWEKEMKQFAHHMQYEKAAEVRDRIEGLTRLYERVYIRHIGESDLVSRIESADALTQLKQILALPSLPLAIEAFDISHIQGYQPVGSMVYFSHGLPHKGGYRLYHIKSVLKPDDTAMMGEILYRRYSRIKREGLPMPQMVLVDGGKPQLSEAVSVFTQLALPVNILVALAKEKEELFVPGRKDSIVLPPDSSALLLLRRVRDEAHRFALTFHRKTRQRTLHGLFFQNVDKQYHKNYNRKKM